MIAFRRAFRRLGRCKGQHQFQKVTAYTDDDGALVEVYRCQRCKRRRFLTPGGAHVDIGKADIYD